MNDLMVTVVVMMMAVMGLLRRTVIGIRRRRTSPESAEATLSPML